MNDSNLGGESTSDEAYPESDQFSLQNQRLLGGYESREVDYPLVAASGTSDLGDAANGSGTDDFLEAAYPGQLNGDLSEQPLPFAAAAHASTGLPTDSPLWSRMHRCASPALPMGDLGRPLNMVCVGPNFCVGGVRQHALGLAKFLDPKRIRISEFLITDPLTGEAAAASGLPAPVAKLDDASMSRMERECDVVLMWGDGFNRRITCRRPVRVFVAHGETAWTRQALTQSSRVVDHVIAVSNRVRQRVCKGFSTTTILNGVDTARLSQSRSRDEVRRHFAFAPSDFVVGSVGRFTQEKQFALLIQSVQRLPTNFKLLLVGSGRRQHELQELANRCIPGRFGVVAANSYLGDYYSAMDAFGMVSAHEGFGLVLAEAMICGRPVFATNVGCVPEVICDRVNGLVVQPEVGSIAEAIRLIQMHRHWARGMACQGQSLANTHLHAARMAREYEMLLCRLVYERKLEGREAVR